MNQELKSALAEVRTALAGTGAPAAEAALSVIEVELGALDFTSARPTRPGFYWARIYEGAPTVPVMLVPTKGGLLLQQFGVEYMQNLHSGVWPASEWCGPIAPPKIHPFH